MMSNFITRGLRTAILASSMLAALSLQAFAHEYKLGDLEIDHPWSRATPAGAKVAVGYLKIRNNGTQSDRLIAVASEISTGGEIHEMSIDDKGVMTMRPLADGIVIEPGKEVELAPGGLHLMFTGLTSAPEQGKRFKGELSFEKAGNLEIEYAVEAIGAAAEDHSTHDHGAEDQSVHDHSAHEGAAAPDTEATHDHAAPEGEAHDHGSHDHDAGEVEKAN